MATTGMDMNNSTEEKVDTSAHSINGGNMDSDKTDHDTTGLADPGPSHNEDGIVEEFPTGFKLYAVLGSLVMSMLLVRLFRFHARREENLMTLLLSRPHSTWYGFQPCSRTELGQDTD